MEGGVHEEGVAGGDAGGCGTEAGPAAGAGAAVGARVCGNAGGATGESALRMHDEDNPALAYARIEDAVQAPLRRARVDATGGWLVGAKSEYPLRPPYLLERRSVLLAVVALEWHARLAVEEDLLGVPRAEIEHVGDRAGELVERPVADATEAPVVLDESDHRRLIDQGVVDEIHAAPGGDD